MLKTGILNPHILSLMARVRHTNVLVIADRGFPYLPLIETVDVSLTDDVPTVLQVLAEIRAICNFTQGFMAREFKQNNPMAVQKKYIRAFSDIPLQFEPHVRFKSRVPQAIGLIRSGDATPYANIILISG